MLKLKHTLIIIMALFIAKDSFAAPAKTNCPKTNTKIVGNVDRGAKLFDRVTCGFCHPGGGNAVNPQKTLYGKDFNKRYPDDAAIAKVVRNGIKGTAMQAFAKDKMTDAELADVIAYIRSLSKKAGK